MAPQREVRLRKNKIREALLSGVPLGDVCLTFDVSEQYVQTCLSSKDKKVLKERAKQQKLDTGISENQKYVTPKQRERMEFENKILELVRNGNSLTQVAEIYDLSRERIRQILKKYNVSIREIRKNESLEEAKRKLSRYEEISQFIFEHPGISERELSSTFPDDYLQEVIVKRRALILEEFPLNDEGETQLRVDIIKSLRDASLLSYPLTGSAYDRLLDEGLITGLSRGRILQVFGSWNAACSQAEVEPGVTFRNITYVRTYSRNDMIRVVGQFLRDSFWVEKSGGMHDYDPWRQTQDVSDSLPSSGTIRNQVHPSWKRVKQLALVELRRNWSNPDTSLKVVEQ